MAPALDIASNMFLGREIRMDGPLGQIFRKLDTRGMRKQAREQLSKLGIMTGAIDASKLQAADGGAGHGATATKRSSR